MIRIVLIIVQGALCLLMSVSFAQENPNKKKNLVIGLFDEEKGKSVVEEKISDFAKQVDEIVIAEKENMEEEINAINQRLGNNEISLEESEELKEVVSVKYAAIIDEKINDLNFDLDELLKMQIKASITKGGGGNIEKTEEEIRQSHKKFLGISGMYLSYSAFGLADQSDLATLSESGIGYSNSFDIGFVKNYRFGLESPWIFTTGLGMSWVTLKADDNFYFEELDNEIQLVEFPQKLDKSKLRSTYLMVPAMIQYSFSKKKDVGKGVMYRNTWGGLRIGVGGYGGLRVGTKRILKFKDETGRDMKHMVRDNFNVNDFRYGLQFQITYDEWSLFMRKDLSDYFRGYSSPINNGIELGIRFDMF